MLFGGSKQARDHHGVAIVRDVVEVVAIIAAGIWAFYVFAYENRIKPSLLPPELNVSASMTKIGVHNGLIGVGLHLALHNIGTVKVHFLGVAVNVYGQRIVAAAPQGSVDRATLRWEFSGFYRALPRIPVYSYAYVTQLGDPRTGVDAFLNPGGSIEDDRTFYVPQGRFDLLTMGIDATYTKFEDQTIPTNLVITRGAARISNADLSKVYRYNIVPAASLDIR